MSLIDSSSGEHTHSLYCYECGYALRGLEDQRCPECGGIFDPSDHHTVTTKKPLGPIARWWLRPTGWPAYSTTVALAICVFWMGLGPAFYYMVDILFLLLLWPLALLTYALRAAIREVITEWHTSPGLTAMEYLRVHWRRDAAWWLCIVAVTAMVCLRVPLRIGFLTARPGMDELVRIVERGDQSTLTTNQVVGLYTIYRPADQHLQDYDRLVFRLADDRESGFVFAPDGIDELHYNAGNKGHLIGDWYWMAED